MSETNTQLPKLTAARLIFIRELAQGPKRSTDLRNAYFGPARSEHKANTSFNNKRLECLTLGIAKKNEVGAYELGEVGKQLLKYIQENNISMDVKSEAEQRWSSKVIA